MMFALEMTLINSRVVLTLLAKITIQLQKKVIITIKYIDGCTTLAQFNDVVVSRGPKDVWVIMTNTSKQET